MKQLIGTAIAALALAGCAVGPDFKSPGPQAPGQAPFVSGHSPTFTQDQPPGRWWSLFNDPTLDRLVEQALVANTDLRVAAANLARSRAVLRETRAGRLPSTNTSASATYGQQPGFPSDTVYDAGLDASYQVDLFGRLRRAVEASRADVEAVQAAYDLTRVTVVAETIRAYADSCSAGRQLAVARETLRVQEETFDLTRRLEAAARLVSRPVPRPPASRRRVRSNVSSWTRRVSRATASWRPAEQESA